MSTDHRDTGPSPAHADAGPAEQVKPPAGARTFSSVLLWISGIPLWGLFAAALLAICSIPFGRDLAFVLFIGWMIFLDQASTVVGVIVGVALLAYAAYCKPWRAPSFAWGFWLQVLLAVLVLGLSVMFKHDMNRGNRVDPQQAAHEQRIDDDNTNMTKALRTDDAVAFQHALADCAADCDRATWASEAVRKSAPRILAVTLEGVRRASEVRLGGSDPDTFCKGGIAYALPPDMALRVGFRNVPAITAQFLPLWGPEERTAALHGAAMSGSIALMNQLVALGVDPLHPERDTHLDGLYASAAAGAATGSIDWLAKAGVTLHTAGDVDEVWYRLAAWADANPPKVARRGAEAWLAESAKMRADGAALQNRIAPLERAVYVGNPVVVQMLLQHGYRIEDLSPEYRALFDAMQDPIRHPHKEVSDTVCDDDAN